MGWRHKPVGIFIMKNTKSLAVLFLSIVSLAACAVAQETKPNMKDKPRPTQTKPVSDASPQEEFKVLAAGQQSGVEEPFVFVARTPETFARLAAMAENLPAASEIDFRQTAVVAAFAGTKPTGGFSVNVRRAGEKISVATKAPGKGMMVTQIMTSPFKIVLVPVENDDPVLMEVAAEWTNKMQSFQLSKGNFEFTGGIAGIRKTFATKGTLKVLTHAELATFIFDLNGSGAEKNRRLAGVASGTINAGNIILERVDAGTFVDNPHPPLKASGRMNEKTITLNFESHTSMIADGFTGRGTLAAAKSR